MIWRMRRLADLWGWNFGHLQNGEEVRFRACWRKGCGFALFRDETKPNDATTERYMRATWKHVIRQHDALRHGGEGHEGFRVQRDLSD